MAKSETTKLRVLDGGKKESDVREQGIQAIIFLQGMAGIKETPESAAAGWDSMSASEKKTTLNVYEMFKN